MKLPECCPTWTRGFVGGYVCTSGGSGRTGETASKNCADVAYPSSELRSLPVHQRASGECQVTRRSNKRCAITISTRSVYPDSLFLPKHNPIEPPWYVTRMPGGVTGKAREGLPMSINDPFRGLHTRQRKPYVFAELRSTGGLRQGRSSACTFSEQTFRCLQLKKHRLSQTSHAEPRRCVCAA